MKVMITGAAGQLGVDVSTLLGQKKSFEVHSFTKQELDVTNEKDVKEKINILKPDWILHCAAYTNVEAAEGEGDHLNWLINKKGTRWIAQIAAEVGARLVYVSTDYVFDGIQERPYVEDDVKQPINQYGAAKLAGEEEVLAFHPSPYIIRTSWVFGEEGQNFVHTMLKLAESRDEIKVVNDQYGRPTYTKDLAQFMLYLIENQISAGVYHFSNENEATWFEFAKEILKNRAVKIIPVDSSEFTQKAKRPKYSILSLEKVKSVGFVIPTWQNGLKRFMESIEKAKY